VNLGGLKFDPEIAGIAGPRKRQAMCIFLNRRVENQRKEKQQKEYGISNEYIEDIEFDFIGLPDRHDLCNCTGRR
jgi:hypothetical protein